MMEMRELTLWGIVIRVGLSLVIGGVLGIERGRHNRPAGFRTYMLVCLGAAMVMMTNQYVSQTFGVSDPVRMGAQVVSGIGFLGAGTIVMTGKSQIRGITTAAGLWAAACCGLAIGIGFYEGAVIGGITIFLIMEVFQRMDVHIRARSKTMELYLEMENKAMFGEFIRYARENDIDIFDIQIQKNKMNKDGGTSVLLTASSKKKVPHNEVLELLGVAPGVDYIEELQ